MKTASGFMWRVVALVMFLLLGVYGARGVATSEGAPQVASSDMLAALNPSPPSSTLRLIFVHHSTGDGWLADGDGGLGLALRNNNYYVSDTNYCWGPGDVDVNDMDLGACSGTVPVPVGSHTDIGNWYNWFVGAHRDTYMTALYAEGGQHCECEYSRLDTAPGGPNRIVVFKSCFPNSGLGGSPDDPPTTGSNPLRGEGCCSENHAVANAKGIYNDLLTYFRTRQDKLFVVVTAPPLETGSTDAAQAANARALNRWLTEKWLNDYPYNNVVVFDFYTVLTSNGGSANTNDLGRSSGNHHRYRDGVVQHIVNQGGNVAAYAVGGDSHPTTAGNQKATGEFLDLLNIAVHCWLGDGGCPLLMGRDVAVSTPTPTITCACETPSPAPSLTVTPGATHSRTPTATRSSVATHTAIPTATPVTRTPTPTPTSLPDACTFHVAPTGDDGDAGSAAFPWGTLQHAADIAQPGDCVCVHTGTYTEEVTLYASGTAGAPITFTVAAGSAATIQGSLTVAPGTSHLNVAGFAVQGFTYWGVTLFGDNHHIRLAHLDVSGGEAGIRLTEGDSGDDPVHGPVSDISIEDSSIRDAMYTAVDCTPGPCDRTAFRRLNIYGSGITAGFGGDGLGLERGRDVVVEDCYIHDNGGDGIDLNSRDFAGMVPGIVVRRNRVVRNHLQGIKLWAGGRMENNVVWGQGINPVMVGAYTSTVEIVNNTLAYNMYDASYATRDYALVVGYPNDGFAPPVTLALVNNIFSQNTGPQVGSPTGIYLGPRVALTEHHNLYWSRDDGEIQADFVTEHDVWFTRAEITGGVWAATTAQGQGDLGADPLFVSGWGGVNVHLTSASPAINAGSPSAPPLDADGRPRDGRPDIGAYEYSGAGTLYLPLVLKRGM